MDIQPAEFIGKGHYVALKHFDSLALRASTKIVIVGGFRVSKTTLIGAVSEIMPRAPKRWSPTSRLV